MPDSRPPIFDDGGGLPDVDRSRRRTDPGTAKRRRNDETHAAKAPAERDVWDNAGDHNWHSPNYLVRRAIVVGIVVVLVAALAFFASRLLGGGSDSGSGSGSADWNSVVAIDDNVGTVVITNAKGEETNRFRLGLSALTDAELLGRTLVGTDADALAVVQLDATADIALTDITTVDIAPSGALARPSGTTQTVIAADTAAQRMVLVHGPDADIIDTAELDTVPGARYDVELAIAEPAGRHVLVTDSGNFQSVLFSFDLDQPSYFPGLALAVNDDVVVTASNVGTNANVAVFDHAGDPSVSAQTSTVRAAMISNGMVILVGNDGNISGLSLSSGEVSDIGNVSIGIIESGHIATRGDRLIVVGTDGTAIIDGDGSVLIELLDARPTVSGTDELAPRATTCLTVERATAGEVIVVGLETGEVGSEAIGNPDLLSTVDGCRPIIPTAGGYIAINLGSVTPITLVGDVIALSPDGGTIAIDRANRIKLVAREAADDTEAEPVDVGRAGRTLFFAKL